MVGVLSASVFMFLLRVVSNGFVRSAIDDRAWSLICTKEKFLCVEALVVLFSNHGERGSVSFSAEIPACGQVKLEVDTDTTRHAWIIIPN